MDDERVGGERTDEESVNDERVNDGTTRVTSNPDPEPPDGNTASRRSPWVYVLIVLAAVILLVTAANTWVKRQMLDTDRWVATSEEFLADDEIRTALSAFVVDELYSSVDVVAQLEQRLPGELSGLAAPLAAGLRGPAVDVVDRLLASSAAQEVWSRSNRRAHQVFVAVLRDDTGTAVSTTAGVVTLELRDIVIELGGRLGLPDAALERIPADVGSVVLVESEQLEELQGAVRVIEWAGIALFVVIAGLFTAAVALARGWRRIAIRHIGLAVLVDSLLLLVLLRFARAWLLDNYVAVPSTRPAVANAWWVASSLLRSMAWVGVTIGVLTIVAAVLVGPSGPAVALRRRIGPTAVKSPVATWGIVAGVLLALAAWTPFDIVSTWLGIVVIVLIVIAAVAAFLRVCEREHALRSVEVPEPGPDRDREPQGRSAPATP